MGGMTLLNNPEFKTPMEAVQEVKQYPDAQTRTQMTMPLAVSQLLPYGIRGCFLAVA